MSRGLCSRLIPTICILAVLPIGKCTDLEINCLYTEMGDIINCLNIFFNAHEAIINTLLGTNDCVLVGIDCDVFNQTVTCINGLPLTEGCRNTIRGYVNSVIALQQITCIVDNLEAACPASPPIVTTFDGGSSSAGPIWILLLTAVLVILTVTT